MTVGRCWVGWRWWMLTEKTLEVEGIEVGRGPVDLGGGF